MPGEFRTSKRRIKTTERQREALELRKVGETYQVIAAKLGYRSRSGAMAAVESALHKTLIEPAEELRTLYTERLNAILTICWPQMLSGDLKAVETVLKVLDRIANLHGLDAPAKLDIQMVEDEVKALAAKLGLDPEDLLAQAREIAAQAGFG